MSVQPAVNVHDIVTVVKPLKNFPAGTQGWVNKIVNRKSTSSAEIIFKYPNLTGSNRHVATLTSKQCESHLRVTGQAPVFPTEPAFVGGW